MHTAEVMTSKMNTLSLPALVAVGKQWVTKLIMISEIAGSIHVMEFSYENNCDFYPFRNQQ